MAATPTERITLTTSDCPVSVDKFTEIVDGPSATIKELRGMRIVTIAGQQPPPSERTAERLLSPGTEVTLTKGRVPVTVLSGFLGAGKTTLLNTTLSKNSLLDRPQKIAIIVNDMSSINIDSNLIERKEEEMIQLQNGCICCTLRGDLIKSVVTLIKEKAPDCLIIESTGIGEVLPIAITFSTGVDETANVQLSSVARLDNLVTVVDALSFPGFINDSTPQDGPTCNTETPHSTLTDLLFSQVSYSNTVVISKLDLVQSPKESIASITSLVKYLNPSSVILSVPNGEVPLSAMVNTHLYKESAYANTKEWKAEQEAIHIPELEQYGVSSFTFSRIGKESRAFNGVKLRELVADGEVMKGVIRVKGCFYQSDSSDLRWTLHMSLGGGPDSRNVGIKSDTRWRVLEYHKLTSLGGDASDAVKRLLHSVTAEIDRLKERGAWCDDTIGDKRIELVFIGRPCDGFNEHNITNHLEQALD